MKILLVVYDNDSYISTFPIGLAYVASALRKAGHTVDVYDQGIYHYPESHLTEFLNKNRYDVIGSGACGGYYQYGKMKKISAAINTSKQRPFYVLGGHLVSPDPEYFFRKFGVDAIVVGEGEESIVNLLSTLPSKKKPNSSHGIVCRSELIKDVDSIPYPAWDLFNVDYYSTYRNSGIKPNQRSMGAVSGRGCTFACNFCYRIDKGFRPRSTEGVIEELQILKKDYHISFIDFFDELLISSVKRAAEMAEGFIKAGLNINYACNGRLNYATPELLKLMKRSGCVFINYGIESLDDGALERMNKHLTVAQIIKGIEATLAEGLSPGLNVIFGNLGETKEILDKDVEFLLKYDDQLQIRTIRPVTPYPGSPLYYHAIEKGLLKDIEDFYENKHINSDLLAVNFTDIPDDEFHRLLYEANAKLLRNYYNKTGEKMVGVLKDILINKNVAFRGFRG